MSSPLESQAVARCLCVWSDLLGFGAALRQGNWDDIESIRPTLDRVIRTEQLALANSSMFESMFMANDGIARNIDFRPDWGLFNLLQWLRSVWHSHEQANLLEQQYGQPGLRTVLVAGSRIEFSSLGDRKVGDLIRATRPNLDKKDLPWIYKAEFLAQTALYMPYAFQMNLAFAKAYALEALGSRGGLSGPRFFLDNTVVDFLLTTLDGTQFEFMSSGGSSKKAVQIQCVDDPDYRAIKVLVPNLDGTYYECGFVALEPQPIQTTFGSVWVVRRIEYPFYRGLFPYPVEDSRIYG